MNEYNEQIQYFAFEYSKHQTEQYLKKYWLYENEFQSNWNPILQSIFNFPIKENNTEIFKKKYEVIKQQSGSIFTKELFEDFIECFQYTKDNYFVVIEDYDILNPPHTSGPLLRFQYPVTINWEEFNLTCNNILEEGICFSLLRPIRNYFVFGDSGKWARYVGNDFNHAIEYLGYEKEFSNMFLDKFGQYII